MKKRMIAALALAAVCLSFTACKKEPVSIDVSDYLDYKIEGYSSQGVLTYEIDYEAILDDNDEQLHKCSETTLKKALKGAWDKTSELANGDEIKFKWDINDGKIKEKFNVVLDAEDIKVKVKDLEEFPEFDPFKYVDVEFKGRSPEGQAELKIDSSSPIRVSYELDRSRDLKNGDTVTVSVTASNLADYCTEMGYKLAGSLSKEFKVEGLEEYVTKISDIDEDMIKLLSQQAKDVYVSKCDFSEDESLDSVEYYGLYFATLKDGVKSEWGHSAHNRVYIVLEATVSNSNGKVKYYYYVSFDDLVKTKEGKTEIYDLYSNQYPDGYMFFGSISGEAFGDTRNQDKTFCYAGDFKTEDIYNNVLRPLSEFYTVDKNFEDATGAFINADGSIADAGIPSGEDTEETSETEATDETTEETTAGTDETEAAA